MGTTDEDLVLHRTARTLREAHGGHWREHPDFPVEDWRYEVGNDETRLGYWEWVASQTLDER